MRTGTRIESWGSAIDRSELLDLGRVLDSALPELKGEVTGRFLAEQLLRIRNRTGKIVPFRPNRAQRAFEQRRGRANIVLKSRQMGISTWVAGRFFLRTITNPGTLTLQVAHTQEAAEGIFRIVHRFLDGLPEWLRDGALRTSKASSRQIVFPSLDSEYRVETAGDANAGRGLTIHNLHCSEVARWPTGAGETLQGLRAAMPPQGELVLESTPNGAEGCFWEEWNNAEQCRMVQHFFPWWLEDAYRAERVSEESLQSDERRLIEQHGLSLEQIGFRRKIAAGFRGLAKQEYPEDAIECFLSSGDCYFDVAALDARIKDLPEPIATRLGGKLQLWFPPVQGRRYLVAVDTAGGGSEGDYSVAQVLEINTGLQCAELRARLSPLELAEESARLAKEYNGAWLVVERNNHGSGVLAYLHSVSRYPHIYRQEDQDGWLTSVVHRPRMLGALAAALVETPTIFYSKRLLQECRSFVRHRNGKIGASAGAHDDCVMAMAIALCVRGEMRL
ncbi:terminase [Alloacidobacterium dinghuense]|uniref:Terminase n=1 Tax=Alloacidobacterium dinghuense TaxID=2763107 RepID=A0A7G8BGF0_9BACT|nr:terminase [Alloacidobacterium dinghuense]QNI31620.1 terminase [Alloacidobacterium dinghuense]